jgi:MFS family permease
MTTKDTQSGSGSARMWVLALTSVAALMVALDALVVTTALSTIRLHLHASIEQLEWTINAYALSFAVLLMTGSALGDRFGRRRLFTAGLGLFTAASAACAVAPDIGSLIAARAVQGAGAAMVMPLALAQLSAAFPPERRAWALGIFSSVTGLAVLGGPVVAGAITQGKQP